MNTAHQRQALSAAAQWFARLGGAPHDETLYAQWQNWHKGDPLHQWAWQQVGLLQSQLGSVQGSLGYSVLARANQHNDGLTRRTALKGLLIGAGLGAFGWTSYRQAPVLLADLRTATGEQRTERLSDGTTLVLNTGSAVDLSFTAQTRLVILRAGEVLIETAKDSRPFMVRSAQGSLRALGTRFSVRQEDDQTRLSVFEHAVAIRPGQRDAPETVIHSGKAVSFDRRGLFDQQPLAAAQDAWVKGRLVVDGWRLDRLIAELQRYTPGYLGCAPDIAHLLVSGSYPLNDINLTLTALTRSLPISLVRHTPYWTRLVSQSVAA